MGKRTLALLVTSILLLLPNHAAANESWRWEQCRFKNLESGGDGWTTREIAKTVRCAARRWTVDGGVTKALDVGRCESGLDADEYGNPPYIGVYQFAPSTFEGAADRFAAFRHRWGIPDNPWNGRANVVLAIRVAHAGGWGPWSCA